MSDKLVRSVSESQDQVLDWIRKLHCPTGFDCDLTYGNGGFWKTLPRPAHCFDLEPLHAHVVKSRPGAVPLADNSVGSAVIDLPFLTYVRNGRNHKGGNVRLTNRFGGYWTYDELIDDYQLMMLEAHRILKEEGMMVFKCQDIVHNHRLHATHIHVVNLAYKIGFRLLDLFVLAANHRMPSPQKGVQKHARIYHSYFLVFKKLKGPQ